MKDTSVLVHRKTQWFIYFLTDRRANIVENNKNGEELEKYTRGQQKRRKDFFAEQPRLILETLGFNLTVFL